MCVCVFVCLSVTCQFMFIFLGRLRSWVGAQEIELGFCVLRQVSGARSCCWRFDRSPGKMRTKHGGGFGGAKLFCVKPNGETLQVSTAENGTRHWERCAWHGRECITKCNHYTTSESKGYANPGLTGPRSIWSGNRASSKLFLWVGTGAPPQSQESRALWWERLNWCQSVACNFQAWRCTAGCIMMDRLSCDPC